MKSSMSKEFYAELKVLCKVHHINVVELIGYASGDGHLYLVCEYVINGSPNEHLHDLLPKGHQPLSSYARAQIALDALRGIEYIHDLTKARYVHRDIKSSNILLDNGLRAKVADFGLAKLMERSSEDEFIATCLVRTPGYLPPEVIHELQMTSKTDVFAFGVLLAEMITSHHTLFLDKNEPNKLKSLASMMIGIFREDNPEIALEAVIDGNLKNGYPEQQVYKVAAADMGPTIAFNLRRADGSWFGYREVEQLASFSGIQLREYDDAGTVKQNYASILVMLLHPRQVWQSSFLERCSIYRLGWNHWLFVACAMQYTR